MPIRTNRGRAAVYRRIWGAPLRSPKHLIATVVVLVILITAVGFLLPRVLPKDPDRREPERQLAGVSEQTETSRPEVTETRLTESPLTPKSAPPAQAALVAARKWAQAWVDHPRGTTQAKWLAGMRPYTTEEFLPQLKTVDVRNIPATKVVGPVRATDSPTSPVEVSIPTAGPTLLVPLIKRPGGWRVNQCSEEERAVRAGVLIGGCLAMLFALVVSTVMVVDVVSQSERAAAEGITPASCDAAIGPTQPGNMQVGADAARKLDPEQRRTVQQIIAIGKKRKLSPRAWQIAIQAGMTESGLRNVDYGDRDSLGIFQMRPSMGWGTPEQVTDPEYAINKFYNVLQGVPDWEKIRPGDAAQAVERSAFPDRYHQWEAMAVYLVENLGNVTDASGCGEGSGNLLPPNPKAAKAIEFALG